MGKHDNKNVWLEDIGIIHMGPRMTAAKSKYHSSTMLNKSKMKKLVEILEWIEKEKLSNIMFWEWKHIKGESDEFGPYNYWRLCPRIMFLCEKDAVYFKMVYGAGNG